MRNDLLAKFTTEMLDLSDMRDTYKNGGFVAANEMLKAISLISGVRIKITNALVVPH